MSTGKVKLLEAFVKKDDIPIVYKNIAPIYDLWGMFTETKARKRCLELANIRDGEKVLEVAVGTGSTFIEILKRNPNGQIHGIDITEQMLSRAKKKAEKLSHKNYSLELGDAYNLSFPEAMFDLVVNNYMFDLLPEEAFPQVLNEFKRVLRPGGRLIMANMAKGLHWYNSVFEIAYRIHPPLLGGCRGVYLIPYLESAGFTDLHREYMTQTTYPTEVISCVKPMTS